MRVSLVIITLQFSRQEQHCDVSVSTFRRVNDMYNSNEDVDDDEHELSYDDISF